MGVGNENPSPNNACGSPFCYEDVCVDRQGLAPEGPADPVEIYTEAVRDSFKDEYIEQLLFKKRFAEALFRIVLYGAEELDWMADMITLPQVVLDANAKPKQAVKLTVVQDVA